ncbi:MAG TPA: hypothetical protein VNH65_01140 [Candidatus Acidoferrum sp.]|nr:hypothetical protein [Candidatus Acidoferrum sp.]
MMEPADKERAKSDAVEQKSTMLTAQVLWAAHAFNATPQAAAQQVVVDLFNLLAAGGSVSVRVTGMNGEEHLLETTAKRQLRAAG